MEIFLVCLAVVLVAVFVLSACAAGYFIARIFIHIMGEMGVPPLFKKEKF